MDSKPVIEEPTYLYPGKNKDNSTVIVTIQVTYCTILHRLHWYRPTNPTNWRTENPPIAVIDLASWFSSLLWNTHTQLVAIHSSYWGFDTRANWGLHSGHSEGGEHNQRPSKGSWQKVAKSRGQKRGLTWRSNQRIPTMEVQNEELSAEANKWRFRKGIHWKRP